MWVDWAVSRADGRTRYELQLDALLGCCCWVDMTGSRSPTLRA